MQKGTKSNIHIPVTETLRERLSDQIIKIETPNPWQPNVTLYRHQITNYGSKDKNFYNSEFHAFEKAIIR